MKKQMLCACVVGFMTFAGTAVHAGGEGVIAQTGAGTVQNYSSSSGGGIIVPLILLVLVALAVASD